MRAPRGSRLVYLSFSDDPDEIIESCGTLDFARERAARMSKNTDPIVVWHWNDANGLRKVRTVARGGKAYWYRPCKRCDEKGCSGCDDLGAVQADDQY